MTSQWKDELSLYGEEEHCRVNVGHKRKNYSYQFKIENQYLLRQNELLNKELIQTRYTIQALKNMIKQKETTINQTKEELDKSIQQIQLLTWSLKQNSPFLSDDSSSTSSSSSSSSSAAADSDEELDTPSPKFDIKAKICIRQHPENTTLYSK